MKKIFILLCLIIILLSINGCARHYNIWANSIEQIYTIKG